MNDENTVLLSRCGSILEAEIIKGILLDAAIESFATNQLSASMYTSQQNPYSNSVDVYVREKDAELAVSLLNANFVKE